MIDSTLFRDIISGRRSGGVSRAIQIALRPAAYVYEFAVQWRNRRYDRGAAVVHHASAPVISVGNITLGGTGKTPMVEWIARRFSERGLRAAIISRGYGSKSNEPNDESRELRLSLPDVCHVQNPDRVSAARDAVQSQKAQVIVLDDAFQHRRIHRDLDIVLIDALEPFGFWHIFPRGMLREPLDELSRADVVILSRADMVEPSERAEIWKTVRKHAGEKVEAEAIHAPRSLIAADGRKTTLDAVRGQPVAAFCGIGNPAAFRRTLENCGCRVAGLKTFPDHHGFTQADIDSLAAWAEELQASTIICTRKDIVKLSAAEIGGRPLWALGIELEFVVGREAVETALDRVVQNSRS